MRTASQPPLVPRRMKAPGARCAAVQALAAGAGVGAFHMALVRQALGQQSGRYVAPGAGAGVGQLACQQLVQHLLVARVAAGLEPGRFVGQQAAGGQLGQDALGGAALAAR